MNKLFAKIASLTLGLALVAGAGVALASNAKEAKGVRAVESLAATFTCGADGAASHADGSGATTYSETVGDYTLSISNGSSLYTGARDAKGNGCLKFGTSKAVGSMSIAIPSDVILVKLYVGGYKANDAKISVNGGSTQTISDHSNDGSYTSVDVNTTTNKTLTFTTVSGGVRAMINTIEFYINAETGKDDSSVSITNAKPLELDINDDPVQLAVTTNPANLNLTYTSSNESVVTVSNSGLVSVAGLGTATITVAFAGNDDYNPSSDTISVTVSEGEPAHITGKTISQIVSEITTAGTSTPVAIYEVEGYITSWDGSKTDGTEYGNFYIADVAGDTANAAYVYGANYGNSPVWNGQKYTFSNNRTFLTNDVTKEARIGSKITANFMAWMYNGSKFEFQGEIKTVQNDVPVVTHTVSFVANGGEGTMDSVQVNDGASYTLPICTFTAPEGKVFDHWEVAGVEKTSLESVTADVEVTATWKDKPAGETVDYDFSSDIPAEWTSSMDKTTTDTSLGRGIGWGAAKGTITLTLSNSSAVSSVVITASTNNTGNTLAVAVGGTSYGDAQEIASGTDNKNKEYSFEGSSSGDVVITVEDTAKTVWILAISVTTTGDTPVVKELVSISVSGAKSEFTVGEEFVTTGLVVTGHYDDSSTSTIASGYEVDSSAVDSTKAGTYNVVVSYETFDANYDVTYSDPTPAELATYKKVETNLADFSGDYLIVYEPEEGSCYAFNGALEDPDATPNTVEVTINNGLIQLSDEHEFHVAKKEGGYSLQSDYGMYIGKTADSNGMDKNASDNYTNTINYDGTLNVVGSGKPVLRYNASSGQEKFRFYKSSTYTAQKEISFYAKVADKAEALALDLLNGTYATCAAGYDNAKEDFAGLWSDLVTAYNGLDNGEKAKLADVKAKENGVMLEEAMARYDLLVAKYELTSFIDGRPAVGRYSPISSNEVDSNAAITIITIIAVTSISAIAVLLVVKKRKTY